MSLPFSHEQFFEVFRRYNEAIWPMQAVLTLLALAAVALLLVPSGGRAVSAILAGLWAWMAIAYHVAFFATINPAAFLFAALFLAGAAAFAWSGAWRCNLRFGWPGAPRGTFGAALILFALLGYPLAADLLGQRYPAVPSFGLPCPTTLLTAGVLLFLRPPYPRHVVLVPLAWSLIGTQAALLLGVAQDFALIAAAAAFVWLALPQARPKESPA